MIVKILKNISSLSKINSNFFGLIDSPKHFDREYVNEHCEEVKFMDPMIDLNLAAQTIFHKDIIDSGRARDQLVLTRPESNIPLSSKISSCSLGSEHQPEDFFREGFEFDNEYLDSSIANSPKAVIDQDAGIANNLFAQFEQTNVNGERTMFEKLDFTGEANHHLFGIEDMLSGSPLSATPKLGVSHEFSECNNGDMEKYPCKLEKQISNALTRAELQSNAESIPARTTNPKAKKVVPKSILMQENPSSQSAVTKKEKSLALRADVMNKNMFRAIRRECKSIFDSYLIENNLSNKKGKRVFNVNLNMFSRHLLESTSVEWQSRRDFDQNEFIKYLGVFLNMCLMKKSFTLAEDKLKVQSFNELLYGYSHKKFFDFITIPEVSTLIKMIFEISSVDGFIANHETLVANREEYCAHIKQTMRQI